MGVDDLLIAVIIGGLVLSGAYLKSQFALQRRLRTAERQVEDRYRPIGTAM